MIRVTTLCAAVVLLGSASGCLFDEVAGIPCENDGDCPTTYFCDLPRSECRAASATEGIPKLDVTGVRDASGQLVVLPKLPDGATTPIGLLLKNTGDGPADAVGLSFAFLACASFEVHGDTLPDTLEKNKTAEVTVDVTTAGPECASVKIVDWFLSFGGRQNRGTFDLDIEAPPGP